MSDIDNRPVSELIRDALNQFSQLVRNELRLARAEISLKVGEASTGVGLMVGASFLLVAALVLLLMALASWIEELGTRASLAQLIAGVVGLVVVAALAAIGMSRVKANALVPNRTINQIQRDVTAAKEHV